ncbi:MAG TPA: alkaline phosphatase family protein, partial [Pyrinomonadaceae bacterium]|nr:alkaline phosphatase family protein [Pyrinomonadaceae bacterium]
VYLLIILAALPIVGQRTRPTTPAQVNRRPRLVLLIAVDQFRRDYLERFGDLFVNNGFRRLLRDGASWEEANYDHVPTYTACGHATMMTGAYPSETGIVGNEWIERETAKRITSVSDTTVKALGGNENEPAASPRRLMASTVGDELRLATNDRSKVIGISVKDRSAILPAGRHANAAYWFSSGSGNMISSTYYFPQLPAWVSAFNSKRPADKFFGARWDRLLPESEYLKRAGADSPPWENIGRVSGDTNAFPHTLTGGATRPGPQFYAALDYSPFSNDLLVQFAEEALVNENLGQDNDTDVLTLSFSANDYVGHRYGPYSQEAMDISLRVDRQIETFLDFVDSKVGLRNTIVILTADHGVAPIPEQAAALGLDGARLRGEDILTAVRSAITARYNPKGTTPDPTGDYIYTYDFGGRPQPAFINGNIYFNYAALQRDGVSLDEVTRVARDAALTVRGISRAFTRAQLLQGAVSITDPIERRVVHGFYASRSGDVVVIAEPYKYLGDAIPATHGTPYSYDTHVPLIIVAPGLVPGRYYDRASPADIAPTVSALLRTTPPSNAVGRVLIEAIRK